VTMQALSTCQL